MDLTAGAAFAGGLLTFASPCVLPLIPIYLSVLVGGSLDDVSGTRDRLKLFTNGAFFVLGFLLVFVMLGLTASAMGRFMVQNRLLFQQIGGLLVFFFGLKFLGIAKLDVLDREKRFNFAANGRITPLSALVIGLTFAFGWTPCIGPILGSILTFTAVSSNSLADGAWMLFVYGLGLGLPLLLVALFAQQGAALLRKMNRFIPKLERATGVVLVVIAVLMVTDHVGLLTFDVKGESAGKLSKEMVVKVQKEGPARHEKLASLDPQVAGEPGADAAGEAQECSAEATSCGIEEDPGAFVAGAKTMSLNSLTHGPVVLDFYKPDCPACMKMVPVMRSLSATCSGEGLRVEKIDISDPVNRQVAMQMGVVGTPTFLFFDATGQEVSRLVGYQEFESIHQAIAVLMGEQCADFSPI